jgi:membrane-bound inhibitor of C-type lysozyme
MRNNQLSGVAIRGAKLALIASMLVGTARAADLTIHLPETASVSRKNALYKCDASGSKVGVPTTSFQVEYINAGVNSIVVVPIAGNSLIFSNVLAGSGARYTAQTYTWWESGSVITLSSESAAGRMQTTCHRVK